MVQKSETENIVEFLEENDYVMDTNDGLVLGEVEADVYYEESDNSIVIDFNSEDDHLSVMQDLVDENYEEYSVKILDTENTKFKVF